MSGSMVDNTMTRNEELLWESEERDVYVLDLPQSIKSAQTFSKTNCERHLITCEALEQPFSVNEPVKPMNKAKITNHGPDEALHAAYATLCVSALSITKISTSPTLRYHLPRHVVSERMSSSRLGQKRRSISPTTERAINKISGHEIQEGYFYNETDSMVLAKTDKLNQVTTSDYLVPPHAAFLIGACEDSQDFRASSRDFLSSRDQKRFDLILLDPPWPNRSVRRSSSYTINPNLSSLSDLLLNIDLDSSLNANGHIAIWITNRPAVRNLVLGPGGLFASWNVSLIEEWIWLKVTSTGQPVTPIDGAWRKPYEVLLIGKAPENRLEVAQPVDNIKRRVLIGVPDMHSRKPCLKSLFERHLLQEPTDYAALEIFARYLVSGWMSWGNEACKFNALEHWTAPSTS